MFVPVRKVYFLILTMVPASACLSEPGTLSCWMTTQAIICSTTIHPVGGERTKKYYVCFRIQVFHKGEFSTVLDERLDLKDKPVHILFPTGTLGDLLG